MRGGAPSGSAAIDRDPPASFSYPLARPASLARTAGRYADGRFFDDLARLATGGAMGASALIAFARARKPATDLDVDPAGLAWFGFAATSRVGSDTTVEDVAALFEFAYRVGGYRVLNEQVNTAWVGALLFSGRLDEFRFVLERTGTLPEVLWAADADTLHPGRPAAEATDWLRVFNRPFTDAGLEPVGLRPGDDPPFARLSVSPPAMPAGDRPLVSVIVPVYNPDPGLRMAVGSLLAQTWRNLEVILCDDASTRGAEEFRDLAAADPRIRVVRGQRNAGTYAARNMGLSVATGEYVTFNDADDWSHPQRIERQMRDLLGPHAPRASMGWGIRATEDLRVTVLGDTPQWYNLSSLLLRRSDLAHLGGFDTVRKGADTEYFRRFTAVFGEDAVREITVPLAIIQLTPGSLSRGDIRFLNLHPARRQHINALKHWHLHLKHAPAEAFVPIGARAPFPVPDYIRTGGVAAHDLDVLMLASLDAEAPTVVDLAEEVRSLARLGLRVGLSEYLGPFDMIKGVRTTEAGGGIADVLHTGHAVRVLPGEDTRARLVLIRDPAAVETMPPETLDAIRADSIVIIADYSADDRRRYHPRRIAEVIVGRTGVTPLWLPATPTIRTQLVSDIAPCSVLEPALLARATHSPRMSRGREPGTRTDGAHPIRAGLFLDGVQSIEPSELERLIARLTPEEDERFEAIAWGRRRQLIPSLPPSMVRLDPHEVSIEELVDRVDVLVVPSAHGRGSHLDRTVVTALAAGCVVLGDGDYRDHFRDAALYLDEGSVTEWLRVLAASPALHAEQLARGYRFLDDHLSGSALESVLDRMLRHRRDPDPA